jgi:hypothetical protein
VPRSYSCTYDVKTLKYTESRWSGRLLKAPVYPAAPGTRVGSDSDDRRSDDEDRPTGQAAPAAAWSRQFKPTVLARRHSDTEFILWASAGYEPCQGGFALKHSDWQ